MLYLGWSEFPAGTLWAQPPGAYLARITGYISRHSLGILLVQEDMGRYIYSYLVSEDRKGATDS